MKLYDTKSNKTYELSMKEWDGEGYGPDMSDDLIGWEYDYDKEKESHLVDDMDSLVDWLLDWENGKDENTVENMRDLIETYGEPTEDEYLEGEKGYYGRHPVLEARDAIENRAYFLKVIE